MKKNVLIISILLIFFMSFGCNKQFDETTICEKYLPAVVEIKVCDKEDKAIGNATGTVISKDGLILTNRHVIQVYDFSSDDFILYENIYVRFYNETEYTKVDIISISDESDLALLQLDKETGCYFNIGSSEELKYGQKIHTIGNGNGYGLAYINGNVAAPF